MTESLRGIEQRFMAWARGRPDIRAAAVVGSQARIDHPADPLSDLDIVMVADDPNRYLDTSDWLADLGDPWVSFVEGTGTGGGRERRVLFAGERGLDVDFAVFSVRRFRLLLVAFQLRRARPAGRSLPGWVRRPAEEATDEFVVVARRGYRILLDRDGLLRRLFDCADAVPVSPRAAPSAEQFAELCADFWYHALWTAKKLVRGEAWVAKASCDSHMKWQLVRMLEWQAYALHGDSVDTWHAGRFLEEWAEPEALRELSRAFAAYDPADVERALLATMDLFSAVSTDVAGRLGFAHPGETEGRVRRLVADVLGKAAPAPSNP